jgi:nucleotide-binding universal stress UspA family protein
MHASVAARAPNSCVRRRPCFTTPKLSAVENSKLKNVATIVVGVDGSAGAAEALRWAVAEAHLRKARLRIVHAWTYGYTGLPLGGFGAMGGFDSYVPFDDIDPVDLQKAAEGLVETAIAKVARGVEGVEVERRVVEGGAAQVLIGAAVGADLLVVGSRGHGGFAGLMLGSVSQQCVSHAPCPVVVVHSPKATADDHELARAPATENVAGV